MKKTVLTVFLFCFFIVGLQAQNIVKGIVVDGDSEKPLHEVTVTLSKSNIYSIKTNKNGAFTLKNLSNGSYILQLNLKGYEIQNFPI